MSDPIVQLNAALTDRYVIDRELGRGGMATVYLARDLKHERFVALKTLRPEIAVALGPERFLREIKVAARLQHPNILAVYDSGDAGGVLYFVMPFVEGESLRDHLDREPQLPLEDAVRITHEVADALAYAHGHDVVHRDIKPENILLSGGHAIVADFGIARAVSAAAGQKLTETGLAIGTPAYMSPEQAGAGKVDHRSDIYSLACVLYEMLAGQPPFTGPTAQAIMARHSLDSVPRLRIVRETIPDALEQVIKRGLAKVPADRYASAAAFAAAVMATSGGTASPLPARASRRFRPWHRLAATGVGAAVLGFIVWTQFGPNRAARLGAGELDPRHVAVLYFSDLSRDSSLGYLAEGLTNGLIAELSPVRPLDVVSREGVAPYRGTTISRDSVARALGAGSLIAGSVEPSPGGVRVDVRLVDGTSGADVERASFALPLDQLLAMRDSVVGEVARLLREALGTEVRLRERRAGTRSTAAWVLVQRAERIRRDAAAQARDRETGLVLLARADTLLADAERADPRWIEPVILRGWIANDAARYTADRENRIQLLNRGLAHAERAFTLHATDPRVLEIRGTLRYGLWRLNAPPASQPLEELARGAREDLEQAVQADPTLASAHATLSLLFHYQKDPVSSVLAARNAYQADAYLRQADAILERLFYSSYNIMQFGEARRWCAEGGRRFPRDFRFVGCELRMLSTPDATPDIAVAWRLAARIDSLAPPARREFYRHRTEMFVAAAIARAGLRDSARRVLLRARADHGIDPEQELVGYEAIVRTFLGEEDTAVALLKRYVAANPGHSFEVGGAVHWWWRDLRNHPGFRQVLALTRASSVAP